MTNAATTSCPRCHELERELRELKQRVAALEAELAKARKNSSNSSKPPSSDIVKPPAEQRGGTTGKRKRGGQPGHPRHLRQPFTEDELDFCFEYYYDRCPDCNRRTKLVDLEPQIVQQVDLIIAPVKIIEHRGLACHCEHCQKTHYAPIDDDVRQAGLAGPRLTALIAYLKGACHCSFSTIHNFLHDVVGVRISRGQLRNICAKVSNSLDEAYQALLDLLPQEARLNVDETGHKENGKRMWTWCFRAALFTLFKIDPSRGEKVLVEVLGEEFNGVLGCDYFGAYRKYMRECDVLLQFCLAHLIRDLKFLAEHPHPATRGYGRRVLEATRQMFAVIHRREEMDPEQFQVALVDAGDELLAQAIYRVPARREAQNLANRFRQYGASYLRFITTPGIGPTNNLAEQAIRFVVIDRHVTQGSRSAGGRRWLERIWTVMASCAQQGRSVFEFLHESIVAHFRQTTGPSLAPNNTS